MSAFSPYNPFLSAMYPSTLPRRKVFISYFKGDKPWVDALVRDYGQPGTSVFIPRVVGVKDEDDFVDSDNPDYIISAIRERYIQDTSVTIVVVGQCTHSRKYIDWEIKSSLRQPANGMPNGLLGLAVTPPNDYSGKPIWHVLPDRFSKNYVQNQPDISYARYYNWPASAADLRRWIEEAYNLAANNADRIQNPQEMILRNLTCKVHREVHTF
jgi:hypothetical protein